MNHRDFTEAGYRIFALHPITSDGICECQDGSACKAPGKHPVATNWQDTPMWDDEQLDAFDDLGWMDSGYGVLVSGGLMVVDVDVRNGGMASYERLIEAVPELAGAGLVVATGSADGSKHLYFRAPEGVSLVQKHHQYPGIDFKSSGFVVGPGSRHASGNIYKTLIGSPEDISAAPKDLVDLLRRPDAHRATLGGEQVDVTDTELAKMITSVNPDCGYEEWVRVGMALHEVTSGTGLDIWDKWSSKGKKYPGRAALDRRWHGFGKSSIKVGYGTLHKYASESGWIEPVTFDYEGGAEPEEETPPTPKLRHQVWLDTMLEPRLSRVQRMAAQPWVITDIMPAGGVVSLVGGSGTGKSFVAVDMACCIASGTPWHGHEIDNAGSVVYVSAEGAGGIDKRVLAWAQQHGMDDVPALHMILDAPIIDDQKDATLVSETIAELSKRVAQPVRLVILDTLNRVMMGEENSATAMAALMRGVETIRQRLGCAVQIIHHTGHGEQGRARGSSAFFAALDSEVTIRSIGHLAIELENTKSKDSEPFDPVRLKLSPVAVNGVLDRHGRAVTSLVPKAMTMMEEGVALGEMTEDEVMLSQIIDDIGAAYPAENDMREAFYDDLGDGVSVRQKRERFRKSLSGLIGKKLYSNGKDKHGKTRYKVV